LGFGTPPALADISTTFDATGTFSDGEKLGGTVTIDVTTGVATSIDLTVGSDTFNTIHDQAQEPTYYSIDSEATNFDFLQFSIPVDSSTTLIGYGGGPLSTATTLFPAAGGFVELQAGALTPEPTTVPEPSTAIVSAISAVAFIAYGWSRHRQAQRRQAAAMPSQPHQRPSDQFQGTLGQAFRSGSLRTLGGTNPRERCAGARQPPRSAV
jgi:hypothetical protein